jgi:signal recognition particle receptor subunit beta
LFQDPQFPVYVAIAIVAVTILFLLIAFLSRRGKRRRTLVICGPSDAGKTVLFAQLVYKKPVQTYTSMEENAGILTPGGGDNRSKKPLDIVDVPGKY